MKKHYWKIREHYVLTHKDYIFYYNSKTNRTKSRPFRRQTIVEYIKDCPLTDNHLVALRDYLQLTNVRSLRQIAWFVKAIVEEKFIDFPIQTLTPEEFLKKEGIYDLYKNNWPTDNEYSFEDFLKIKDSYIFGTHLHNYLTLNGKFHDKVKSKLYNDCFENYTHLKLESKAIDYIKKEIEDNDL